MKKTLLVSILVALFTLSLISVGVCKNHPPTDAYYELQGNCEKQCRAWFLEKYEYGTKETSEGRKFNYHSNHHNMKLNKCFMMTGQVFVPRNQTAIILNKRLFVINEPKEYGVFSKTIQKATPMICYVGDRSCQSEKEWNTLAAP